MASQDRESSPGDVLLQQVIEHLQRQDIPSFPDPEIRALENVKRHDAVVRPLSTLRRTLMSRRFQLSASAAVALAVMVGLLLPWGGTMQSASAMEKMAESVRKANSFKATVVMEDTEAGKESMTISWVAPGWSRSDIKDAGHAEDITQLFFADRLLMVQLDRKAKTLKREPCNHQPGITEITRLGEFTGQADRDLGFKKIEGKKAYGFEIAAARLWPHNFQDSSIVAQVWIDSDSSLPMLVELLPDGKDLRGLVRMRDFQWNIAMVPETFDTRLPKGYTDITPDRFPANSGGERAALYAEALKLYLELTESRTYPPAITDPDNKAMKKGLFWKFGFDYFELVSPPRTAGEREDHKKSQEQNRRLQNNDTWKKTSYVTLYFFQLANDLILNSDAAYYGRTVRAGEKDKVLVRWKLDDGRYEVIFGDLRAETVTAEKLHALEKWGSRVTRRL
jgi:outer membrane lipoprotein-sorting protein